MRKEMIMRVLMVVSLVLLTGFPALPWIKTVDEDLTWVYYNGNGVLMEGKTAVFGRSRCEGLYEMAFVDSVVIDNRVFKEFKAVRSVFRQAADLSNGPGTVYISYGMADTGYYFWEKEGKVYWTYEPPGNEENDLVYDYDAKEGDPYPALPDFTGNITHCLPDTVLGDGKTRKMYTAAFIPHDYPDDPIMISDGDFRCIEGIGATRGNLMRSELGQRTGYYPLEIYPHYPGEDDCYLVGVRNKAGEYIYGSRHPMEDLFAGVSGVEADDYTTPRYFNLQGLPVESPKTGDIIIKVTGNRTEKTVWK